MTDNYMTDIYKLGYNNDDEGTAHLGAKIMGLELDPGFYKKNLMNLSNENFFGAAASFPNALVGIGTASSNSAYTPNPYLINKPLSNHQQQSLFNQQANLSK